MKSPHEQLRHIVCEAFQINDLFSSIREKQYVVARSTFFYLLKQSNYSFNRLGILSGMHHTSVMHSVKSFDEYYKYYFEFTGTIDYVVSEWASIKNINSYYAK